MEEHTLNIGVLTSSRADYGIYLPLLQVLKKDTFFNLNIIAFGTHLKKKFGQTINQIKSDGFEVKYQIDNLIQGDKTVDIVKSYGNTVSLFGEFWNENYKHFDLVLCLGDRFEMAAAVNAGIPFNIMFAHLHAGETSEGAIDNIYRDQISLASKLHFIALPEFQNRVEGIVHKKGTTTTTGAISLENLKTLTLLNISEFANKWRIDLEKPSILITVHPETVGFNHNHEYCLEIEKSLENLSKKYQLIITMPNADTLGSLFRKTFKKASLKKDNVFLIENFGSQSYFSAMKYAKIVIGNSSSGIIEAASFRKHVINIGDRQKNRKCSKNVIHVPFKSEDIIRETENYINLEYGGTNIYQNSEGISSIVKKLKNLTL